MKLEKAINSHDTVATWDWARETFSHPGSKWGANQGAIGTGAKHRRMNLDVLRALLVGGGECENNLATVVPGEGAGRSAGKVLADAIALRELLANKVASFQAEPDDTLPDREAGQGCARPAR